MPHVGCCPECRARLDALERALVVRAPEGVSVDELERAVEIQFRRAKNVRDPLLLKATIRQRLKRNTVEVRDTLALEERLAETDRQVAAQREKKRREAEALEQHFRDEGRKS